MRIELKLGLVSLVVIGLAASCGGRSGIELGDIDDLLDASVDGNGPYGYGGGVVEGGKKDVTVSDTTLPPDVKPPPKDVVGNDQKDLFDSLPPWIPEGGPIGQCVGCLQGQCGTAINACYNDASCWNGIQCAIPKCFLNGGGGSAGSGGGQLNFPCFLECFDNKMSSIMEALNMFQCITGTCGSVCGMGGMGGNGGGGGGANLTGFHNDPAESFMPPAGRYIGAVRVPEPEEVSCAYPWLADVLDGRTPDPLPPSASARDRR
jgi:hypothetical protein